MSRLMVGRAMMMLMQGLGNDAEGAVAGVLTLGYGLSLRQLLGLRWADVLLTQQVLRVDDDDLPLTPAVLEILVDYRALLLGVGLGDDLLFSDEDGQPLRLSSLAKRITELTGGWFPADTLRAWARAACPELLFGGEQLRILDEYSALGATDRQRESLADELIAQRRAAVDEWHNCLAWCGDQAATG